MNALRCMGGILHEKCRQFGSQIREYQEDQVRYEEATLNYILGIFGGETKTLIIIGYHIPGDINKLNFERRKYTLKYFWHRFREEMILLHKIILLIPNTYVFKKTLEL